MILEYHKPRVARFFGASLLGSNFENVRRAMATWKHPVPAGQVASGIMPRMPSSVTPNEQSSNVKKKKRKESPKASTQTGIGLATVWPPLATAQSLF